jgi:hypothetical protein
MAAEKEDYASLSNDHYGLTVIHCDGRAEDSRRPVGAPNNAEPSGALTALEGINNRVETARRALIGALPSGPRSCSRVEAPPRVRTGHGRAPQ